ncbi:hypothetical protein [Paenibacillus hunanensis]|uniref:Uncharacterized protein n=1 Tax=Paenibacillus hunanensis TaxID=539262 RepID=A0ABU1J464_9BACL|nr:hypothetical protein [Paenibacillus hunanensis]MDR6246299.1 hypothetical protein [Paenibacillus hunanensis]GGJ30853.1 hypothetical protein GCM10008022_44520 [Paenibacillus hunanensis]
MMKFFKKKSEPTDRLQQADAALNKGLSGMLIKGLVPKEQRQQMSDGLEAAKQMQAAASGSVAITAMGTIVSVKDTGKLVNFDPIVLLTMDVVENSGSRYSHTMETLVPKMQIPRPGDVIGLGTHPAHPSSFIYMGPLD